MQASTEIQEVVEFSFLGIEKVLKKRMNMNPSAKGHNIIFLIQIIPKQIYFFADALLFIIVLIISIVDTAFLRRSWFIERVSEISLKYDSKTGQFYGIINIFNNDYYCNITK